MRLMSGFVVLTLPPEAEHVRPPSAETEHAPVPTSRTRETQDAISVTCDSCDEGLSPIQSLVSAF
jgi:hypothetical protein